MRYLLFLSLLIVSQTLFANQWHTLNQQIQFITPNPDARYLATNQALVHGDNCSVLIDAHGDFVALEALAKQLKQTLKQPLCYLINTSSDTEQVLGMALLKYYFPNAKWFAPNYVSENFASYQDALSDKIQAFTASQTLSQQRLKNNNNAWQSKLQLARKRINTWQAVKLTAPMVNKPLTQNLSLGSHTLELKQVKAATNGDLLVLSKQHQGLFGGYTVNPIPYVSQGHFHLWHAQLNLLEQSNIKWLMPAQGKPYKRTALIKPMAFLELANASQVSEPPLSLSKMYADNTFTQTRLAMLFKLAQRNFSEQRGLKPIKQSAKTLL